MEQRNRSLIAIIAGILITASVAGWFVVRELFDGARHMSTWYECEQVSSKPSCISDSVKQFHDVDYTESKDLAKSFLTILVGVFVASITFSEKIVDLRTAGRVAVGAMFTCWLLLLMAIMACGLGICAITFALYQATYNHVAPWGLENDAGRLFALSGGMFVCSLLAMLIAGLPSLFPPKDVQSRTTTGG